MLTRSTNELGVFEARSVANFGARCIAIVYGNTAVYHVLTVRSASDRDGNSRQNDPECF